MGVKGYKFFNSDWTCKRFKYEVGKTYTMEEKPRLCQKGFHFCLDIKDCCDYYNVSVINGKIAEIEALGTIDYSSSNTKACTNKIRIIREIPWDEVSELLNLGKFNASYKNIGNHNGGSCNIGDRNFGSNNIGDYNVGSLNEGSYNVGTNNNGNFNTGNANFGNYNGGSYNYGKCNTGNYNYGDYNIADRTFGAFNTQDGSLNNIYLFNKPSNWTMCDWYNSRAYTIVSRMPQNSITLLFDLRRSQYNDIIDNCLDKNVLSENEIKEDICKYTGFVPMYEYTLDELYEIRQNWWWSLDNCERECIRKIPNFDKEIFYKCTGILVDLEPKISDSKED